MFKVQFTQNNETTFTTVKKISLKVNISPTTLFGATFGNIEGFHNEEESSLTWIAKIETSLSDGFNNNLIDSFKNHFEQFVLKKLSDEYLTEVELMSILRESFFVDLNNQLILMRQDKELQDKELQDKEEGNTAYPSNSLFEFLKSLLGF